MGASDESFLPQIVGIFYATFDPVLGPTVKHQVPERLISSGWEEVPRSRSASRSRSRTRPAHPVQPTTSTNSTTSITSTATVTSPTSGSSVLQPATRNSSPAPLPQLHPPRTLIDFSPISEYVIPKKSLHGKLVTFRAPGAWDEGGAASPSPSDSDDDDCRGVDDDKDKTEYRIMGLPSVIEGDGRYQRNQYMWNMCFVFRATANLAAFEPVVRKIARIFRSAELDSGYLSAPLPEHASMGSVLEQLLEDLNSYSETSIPLDGFNSLELRLFPFYQCNDWDVPIALVNLAELKDRNWDITASRVTDHINGINHSARIAQLADADLALVRETLRHMLFYQVVMMIDIFQYSNMYAVTPSFPRLVSDNSVIAECGSYVTRPGFPVPDWPTLAALYSHLQPGMTIHHWMESHAIPRKGIDPRRFVSFGIIKGFIRRVHRWPVIVDRTAPLLLGLGLGSHAHGRDLGSVLGGPGEHFGTRRRVGFQRDRDSRGGDSALTRDSRLGDSAWSRSGPGHPQAGDSQFTLRSVGSVASVSNLATSPGIGPVGTPPKRRTLALTARDREKEREPHAVRPSLNPRSHSTHSHGRDNHGGPGSGDPTGRSLTSAPDTHPSVSSRRTGTLRSGPSGPVSGGGSGFVGSGFGSGAGTLAAARRTEGRLYELEDQLIGFLDGHHHADEIQIRLGMSWNQLEKVLGLDDMRNGVGRKGIAVVYR